MTEVTQVDAYGALIGPDSLRIQRLLPGPIERVWAYLVDSELRKLWMASGDIELVEGAPFELTWRNDELATVRTGGRPEDIPEEHSMKSEVVAVDAPRKLVITWNNTGNVTFELEPLDEGVLLTVTHAGFHTRSALIGHSAGWHAHLDVLENLAFEREPKPFWPRWQELRGVYGDRLPADFGA
jgi:uncharacterized protein YndB with AHSA1/START domain